MCLTPVSIGYKKGDPGAPKQQVACRTCAFCLKNRMNDIIGRCIAEQSTASRTVAVTLTYGGGDTPQSVALRYKDVQLMLKRLRKDGYSVRYICAGEYGTKKGRAHWHMVLFFYGKSPDLEIDQRVDWQYWPHGFVYLQNPDASGFAYVMKYALKQTGTDGYSKSLSLSKKPPLGYRFFMNLADDLVEKRLFPRTPEYSFAHVRDTKGRPRRYWLQGRMRELFLDRFRTMWWLRYQEEPTWAGTALEPYHDKIEATRRADDELLFQRDKQARDADAAKRVQAQFTADFQQQMQKRQTAGLLVFPSSSDLVEAYSDGTATVYYEDQEWQVTASSVTVADQLLRAGLPRKKARLISTWLSQKWKNHPGLSANLSANSTVAPQCRS